MEDEKPQPKLRIWGGGWDLPSIDPDCLTVITYAKFMNAPITLEEAIPPKTVTGTLPELQIEESVFTSPLNILGILRREGYNADFNLNSIDHADTLAYTALVEEKLKPGLLQNFWMDSGNYVNIIRKAYAKSFGFFRSYWNLPQMRNKIEIDLACRGRGTSAEREKQFNQGAKACITLLSQRLGTREFFFGSTPTTFDAIVFGHLAVVLKAPLVSTELKNHLTACDNLCKYVGRISQRYFKDIPQAVTPKKETHELTEAELKDQRKQTIAIAVAIAVNLVYLFATGIFKKSSPKTELVDVDDILE